MKAVDQSKGLRGRRGMMGSDDKAGSRLLREGILLTLPGVALGLAGAAVAGRLVASGLVGVSPIDPVTFTLIPILLFSVALLACYFPARRAANVDPMVALRNE